MPRYWLWLLVRGVGEKEERVRDISVVAFDGQVTNCFGGSKFEPLLLLTLKIMLILCDFSASLKILADSCLRKVGKNANKEDICIFVPFPMRSMHMMEAVNAK
jgi:hypothetical protein